MQYSAFRINVFLMMLWNSRKNFKCGGIFFGINFVSSARCNFYEKNQWKIHEL